MKPASLFLLFAAASAQAATTDLLISEYSEGSSNNKYIEIYNGTGDPVDLSSYQLWKATNGGNWSQTKLTLSGTLADGEVYIVANNQANATIKAEADLLEASITTFNGDDAIGLAKNGTLIDQIGVESNDPGSGWAVASVTNATKDHTLVRKADICAPTTDWGASAGTNNADSQWIVNAQNDWTNLGTNNSNCATDSTIPTLTGLIPDDDATNIDVNTDLTLTFDETIQAGSGNIELRLMSDDSVVESFDVANSQALQFSAETLTISPSNPLNTGTAYYVLIDNAAITDAAGNAWGGFATNTDWNFTTSNNTDSAPSVSRFGPTGNGINRALTPYVEFSEAVDLPTNAEDAFTLVCDGNSVPFSADTSQAPHYELPLSNTYLPAGATCTLTVLANQISDSDVMDPPDNMAADFSFSFTTDNSSYCGEPVTRIHDIQGSGSSSPLVGSSVAIEGYVVGDFENGLKGFFVQEASTTTDADPTTSEGVFVYTGNTPAHVDLGDQVRVTGTVMEYFTLTELGGSISVLECQDGSGSTADQIPVTPYPLTLPLNTADQLEAAEGMLVHVNQPLAVNNTYDLFKYGQFEASPQPLMQPTAIARPGADAQAVESQNQLSTILVDDGRNGSYNWPIIWPSAASPLSIQNTVRVGYRFSNWYGALTYSFGNYLFEPVQTTAFNENSNPRQNAPTTQASLKVVSMNLENFFNGDGAGDFSGNARGASSAEEFNRQKARIVNALLALDADIAGVEELENDGYDSTSAIAELVNSLNSDNNAQCQYQFITPPASELGNGGLLGTDAIKVGQIYCPDTVTPVGPARVMNENVDPAYDTSKNRPALVQTFEENATGNHFTVVVTHLKSKGGTGTGADADQGDGQGNWNATRTAAATALANAINNGSLYDHSNDSSHRGYLLLGDLNSYAMEDPIAALENAGFVDLHKTGASQQHPAWSYQYQGRRGYLDYGMSDRKLKPYVVGIANWHINADEPAFAGYELNGNTDSNGNGICDTGEPCDDLYSTDPLRVSDHDPVVVFLNFSRWMFRDGFED